MATTKNVKILNDAPYNSINFFTISFIDPNNYKDADDVPEASNIPVRGFIVYNAYNLESQAHDDIPLIKGELAEHDITVGEIGKFYKWNDRENASKIEYGRKELNDMETARREEKEKMEIVAEQLQNDKFKPGYRSPATNSKDKLKESLLKKSLQRGYITTEEYQIKMNGGQVVKKEKLKLTGEKFLEMIANIEKETTDHLKEHDSAYEYGCISFFDPKVYKGLVDFCFKIRGVHESLVEIDERIANLKKKYPNDNISRFPVGKWCPFPIGVGLQDVDVGKQLNYIMKLHIEHLKVEKVQFEERKEKMLAEVKKENEKTKKNQDTAPETKEKQKKTGKPLLEKMNEDISKPVFNPKDTDDIMELYEFLKDDEVEGFNPTSGNKMAVTKDGNFEEVE